MQSTPIARLRRLLIAVALIGCGGHESSDDTATSGGATSGGSSAGGSSNGGSSAGKGGSGGSGGDANPTYCGLSLYFRMMNGGPAGGSQFCVGAPNSCSSEWLSILDASGVPVSIGLGCGVAPCATCESLGCPALCAISTPLAAEGVETAWDGLQWVAGTCGTSVECKSPICAPAGDYVARFCGYALDAQGGAGGATNEFDVCMDATLEPTCVDVPFTYPSSDPIVGVLDQTR